MAGSARVAPVTVAAGDAQSDWVSTTCAVCGPEDATTVFRIPAVGALPETAVVRCSRCGLRRLSTRPGPAALAAFYGDQYNAFVGRTRSDRKQRAWNRLRDAYARPAGYRAGVVDRALLTSLATWALDINVPLRGVSGLKVLDVGCGFGDLLIYLKSRGCDTTGVDLDPRAAAQAREYGVTVHVGDLADLALPTAAYDVSVMCHSLEHVSDPNRELAELARVTRPGGRLHLAVPNGDAAALGVEAADWFHLSYPLHVWFFDARALSTLLARHGFTIVVPPRTTSRWHHLTRWMSRVRHAPWSATATAARIGWRSRHLDAGDVIRLVAERSAS